jgi:hypothetical protein
MKLRIRFGDNYVILLHKPRGVCKIARQLLVVNSNRAIRIELPRHETSGILRFRVQHGREASSFIDADVANSSCGKI